MTLVEVFNHFTPVHDATLVPYHCPLDHTCQDDKNIMCNKNNNNTIGYSGNIFLQASNILDKISFYIIKAPLCYLCFPIKEI